jgi:hypothetical protein
MTRKTTLAVIVAVQTMAAAAYAGDAATLSTAREVAKQGLSAYDAGRFDEAVEKLSKAYAVVRVPTLAVAMARALAKSGRLVAASELYLEAAHIPRDKSWQATQDEAQQDAEKERRALLARIPRLTIVATGADLSQVAVRIDGVAVPQALTDTEQMVDPGERHVEGTDGNRVSERSVLLKEGEHARVTLEFAPADAGPLVRSTEPPAPIESGPAISSQMRPGTGDSAPGRRQRTFGWTTVTAGGVGLTLGVVSGLWAMSKRSKLLDSPLCSKDNDVSCAADKAGEVDSYNSMRTVSTVGFIAGGVLTAAGVTLLLTAPKQQARPSAGIWVSPRGAGIYGGF